MAFNWNTTYDPATSYDNPIQGQMIAVSLELSMFESMEFNNNDIFKDVVKERITKLLVDAIIKNKLAEFTFIDDPANDTKKIHARCYLTKDDQVRILRTHGGLK